MWFGGLIRSCNYSYLKFYSLIVYWFVHKSINLSILLSLAEWHGDNNGKMTDYGALMFYSVLSPFNKTILSVMAWKKNIA